MPYSAIKMVLIVTLLVVTSAAGGQSSDRSQKRTFATERAKVAFLVGTFTTAVTISASPEIPNGATGKGTSVITWALDSMFLSIAEETLNSLFGQYKGHGMLGFHVPTQQFVLSMFNNYGDQPTYHGDMAGDTLVLMTSVPAPTGSFEQKLLWYRDGTTVKLKVFNDAGKGFVRVLEQSATPVRAGDETRVR